MNNQNDIDSKIAIVCQNLTHLRMARGWSIEELSRQSGIGTKNLRSIEQGNDFFVDDFLDLCHLYGVRPDDVFREELRLP